MEIVFNLLLIAASGAMLVALRWAIYRFGYVFNWFGEWEKWRFWLPFDLGAAGVACAVLYAATHDPSKIGLVTLCATAALFGFYLLGLLAFATRRGVINGLRTIFRR